MGKRIANSFPFNFYMSNEEKEKNVQQSTSSSNEQEKEKNILFYTVVYLTDGTIHLRPGATKEKCIETSEKIKKSKYEKRIKEIHFIKRNINNYKDGFIL